MPHTLLLADDSITIQRVIELTFADEDIAVIAVGNGQAAIDRAERDRPDIVLADVSMPERDGYEVASFVKSHPALSHVPVVLLTGAFEPVDEARARATGCDGVLVKPFEPQMVIHRVKDLLAGNRPASLWSAGPSAQGPIRPAAPAPRDAPGPSRTAPVEEAPRVVPAPVPVAQDAPAPPKDDPLAAYFDRLDAAVTAKTVSPPAPELTPASYPADAAARPPGEQAPPEPRAKAPSGAAVPSLADAFAALLNAEGRVPYSPQPAGAQAAPEAPDAEALIDAIAGRVLARLHESDLRSAVLEAAERLVREEIERLKRD